MTWLFHHGEMPALGSVGAKWAYWRPAVDGIVELGTLRGRKVGLPTHFHGEDQITFVVFGRRRFLIGGEVVALAAGQGALIPAGVAHRSLAEPSGVVCFNAYVPAGGYAVAAMMRDIERLWHRAGHLRPMELAATVREHRQRGRGSTTVDTAIPAWADHRKSVSQAAERAGMSREGIAAVAAETGFADQSHLGRWFRQAFGVTPGQYRSGWPRSQTFQTRP